MKSSEFYSAAMQLNKIGGKYSNSDHDRIMAWLKLCGVLSAVNIGAERLICNVNNLMLIRNS